MADSTTMTIRLSPSLKDRLSRLALSTRRSNSYLAAEALADYVARELQVIEGVQRGFADVAAGRVVAHDAAMDEVDAVVRAAADKL